jgi:hypothetical protein
MDALGPLAVVDGALSMAAQRGAFERDEAEQLLRDVWACVDEPEAAANAAGSVEEAVAGFGEGNLVDRTRVVDALLDIRSALRHAASSSGADPAPADPGVTAALVR